MSADSWRAQKNSSIYGKIFATAWFVHASPLEQVTKKRQKSLLSLSTGGSIFYLRKYRNDLLTVQSSALKWCAIIYTLRCAGLMFYTQPNRPMTKAEYFLFGLALPTMIFSTIYSANRPPIESTDNYENSKKQKKLKIRIGFGTILYIAGSIISTLSEYQRKLFKSDSNNKGKLYTDGLFSITRHPNYFADLLLFTGWMTITNNIKMLILPIGMYFGFRKQHIPEIESYLASKYSSQWPDYEKNVKSLIPFVL